MVLTNYFCQKTRYVLIKEDLCPISYLFYSSFQGKSQQHLSEVEASKAASNGECAASMFSGPGKEAALRACEAQYAFQRNWYPDPIGGTQALKNCFCTLNLLSLLLTSVVKF